MWLYAFAWMEQKGVFCMSFLMLFPKGVFNTATEINLCISNKKTEPITFKLPTILSSGVFFTASVNITREGL